MVLSLQKQVPNKIKIYQKYSLLQEKISKKNLFNQKQMDSKKLMIISKSKNKDKKIKKRKIVNVDSISS